MLTRLVDIMSNLISAFLVFEVVNVSYQLVACGADGAGGDLRPGELIELEEKGYAAHK